MDRTGEANLARSLATMSVLGFSTPSFSFGTDIVLPVDSNRQLREVLLSNVEEADGKSRASRRGNRDALAARVLGKFADVFVPEVRLVRVRTKCHSSCRSGGDYSLNCSQAWGYPGEGSDGNAVLDIQHFH